MHRANNQAGSRGSFSALQFSGVAVTKYHIGWLETTEIYSSIVLGARSPNRGISRARIPQRLTECSLASS